MRLILGLFSLQSAFANDLSSPLLGSREGDPDSIVENVNVIYRDDCEHEVDLIVYGPNTLTLSRFYSSRDERKVATFGRWRLTAHYFLWLISGFQVMAVNFEFTPIL